MGELHDNSLQSGVFRFDQSEALLHKVMDGAAIGMGLIGNDGRMIFANRAYESMLGHAPGDCLGIAADTMIHELDRQATMLRVDQLLRGEIAALRHDCRMRRSDGTPLWTSTVASLLRSEQTGQPLYAIVQFVNIDRQKRAEEALVYAERRWSSALEAAGQGVWDFDTQSDSMYYSNSWRAMRGIGLDEVINDSTEKWLARVHPDDRGRLSIAARKQGQGEAGFDTLEYRERHRDGHYIWILSRGRPVEWDAAGNVVRTVGTDTDISHLKRIEAQLAAEKERLRVTLQSIGDGVISIDSKSCITFMNPTAEQMTGWTQAEAMGCPLDQVFAIVEEATGKTATSPVARCLAEGTITHLDADVCLIGRHAECRDVQSSASPLLSPTGEVLGAVLVFQDVTSSRALQKQLAHTAVHDALTGLSNRLAFERALITVVDEARHELRTHALCFIDLDFFKPVNDTAGHAAGDALLCKVAEIIRQSCRRQDFAARIGGDEFALLLADCPASAARRVAQKLVDDIAALEFTWDERVYRIGASVGITAISGRAASPADVLGEADSACYVAKANGRGRVALYDGAA
jgi:diguanylate cyclase (GGDEF)-like protein/PAS domain S-box-containing protein